MLTYLGDFQSTCWCRPLSPNNLYSLYQQPARGDSQWARQTPIYIIGQRHLLTCNEEGKERREEVSKQRRACCLRSTPTKVINWALKNRKPRDLSSWQRNATGSDIQGSFLRQLQPVFATGNLNAFACKPHSPQNNAVKAMSRCLKL